MANETEDLNLTCHYNAGAVEWMIPNDRIVRNVVKHRNNSISITRVEKRNEGMYECVAYSKDTFTWYLDHARKSLQNLRQTIFRARAFVYVSSKMS